MSAARTHAANDFTIDAVRRFWDGAADEYVHPGEALSATHFQRFERALRFFEPRPGQRVLNIWSRTGEAVDYFRRAAPDVELVNAEVSPRMLAQARARYPGETFIRTDLQTLPFADAAFDFILSLETLEHAPDPLRLLRELARVLKPGGRLVLSCPPATAELPLRVYERFCRNHGEGPHRFPPSREVRGWLRAAGLELERHEGTLFVPVGPRLLRRLDPLIERLVRRTPLRELGIRQFYVCRRPVVAGPWAELLRDVVAPGLCTRCGTCAGVCPTGVFEFTDLDGQCLPAAVRPAACTKCGLCMAGCPGARVRFDVVHAAARDAPVLSPALGPIRRIRAAYAADPAVRSAGASGGVVTALLGDLLEQGAINGAVVLAAHPRASWRPWPRIARTRAEILRAAQSKYCVTPTNVILADIDPGRDRLALVALPCQVHALRALAARRHPALRAVSLIIGLYCGNQLHFGATRSFLRRHGVRDLSTVAELRYRDGAWPGQVRCTLTDGRTCAVPKFDFNHLISFYVLDRCLLCTDLAAEGADLSVADAWDAGGRMQGGASLVVTRTARGEACVADLVARGVVAAEEIELERAVAMHAHGLDLKKTGAALRIRSRARRGRPVPEYDCPAPHASRRRRWAEVLVSAHFRLLGTRPARWLVDRVPFGLIGRVYRGARTLWKRAAARPSPPVDTPPAPASGRSRPGWRLIGPLLLLVLCWQIGLDRCWAVLQTVRPLWFAAACLLSVPALALKAARWQLLLRAFGIRLAPGESAAIYAAGLLAGAVTPGKVGDLAKVPLLAARGATWRSGVVAALTDRVFDAGAVLLVGLAGMLASPALPGRGLVAALAVAALGVTAVVASVFRGALRVALRRTSVTWWLGVVLATLGALGAYFASVGCCAAALDLPLGVVDVVIGAAAAAVLALLPVSVAGIGTRDAAFVVLFTRCGVAAEQAVALSMLVLAWMLVNCVLFFAVARRGLAERAPAPLTARRSAS